MHLIFGQAGNGADDVPVGPIIGHCLEFFAGAVAVLTRPRALHSGGGEEAEFARRMEALYPNVTALYGKIKLGDEMNLISNLDCVVSMDSLVMHLASLMATPTVSVWGATHPGLGFLGYGFGQEGVLQTDFACRPCSVYGKKPCKYGDYRCIWSIEPQMILDRVERLVGKTE